MVVIFTSLLIFIQLHRAHNTPLRQFRESKAAHGVPLLIPHHTTQNLPTTHLILTPSVLKSPNVIPLPVSQLLVSNLQVIPLSQSNVHHGTIHTDVKHFVTHDNVKIPIISQTVSHSYTNITRRTPTIPMYIPYTQNLVPFHDLSVIPLQKSLHTVHKLDPKLGHYRVMENKDEHNEEPVNIVRSIYGGFGNGLYFGGQGAGHGFHIFG